MSIDLSKIAEDRDVVEPFVGRLLQRLRDKYPHLDITADCVTVLIEVNLPNSDGGAVGASIRIRRMLAEMEKEGVTL